MNNLKRVLITGSGRGLGKAMAIHLAKLGYEVVLHYHHNQQKALETLETVRSLCPSASLLQFDVSDRKQVTEVLEKDMEEKGAYYGVILNAGINADNPFPILEDEEWDKVNEYERSVYNMTDKDFFNWAKENNIDLNAKTDGAKDTLLTYWLWDMAEAEEYED